MNYTEKNKLLDKISVIALMCIFVELFLYAVHFKFVDGFNALTDSTKLPIIMYVVGAIFLIISIVLFVLAFKKSRKKYLLFAIEFLVLALLCPFMTYYYYHSSGIIRDIFTHKNLSIAFLVYYICRIIYVCFHDFKVINFKKLSKKLKKRKSN